MELSQIVQLAGAAGVLGGYAAGVRARTTGARRRVEAANFFGAIALFCSAFVGRQWGFFILNVIWASIAAARLWGLRKADATEPGAAPQAGRDRSAA